MRGSNFGRTKSAPFRIEPARSEVFEDFFEAEADMTGDVLEESEACAGLDKDSSDLGPKVPLILVSESLPGDGEGLTGVSTCDEIHAATPRSSVEGSQVRPDRSRIQGRFFHPRHENGRGETFPLDVANGARPLGQAEVDPSDTGAERDGT